MFWNRRPSRPTKTYDPAQKKPVIRVSICTGERTACFQDLASGRLEEVMLLRSEEDQAAFQAEYGISGEIEIVY